MDSVPELWYILFRTDAGERALFTGEAFGRIIPSRTSSYA